MTYSQVYPQFNVFLDTDGTPLNNGNVYVGTSGLDAESNQITVYFDTALSNPAPQPLSTTNGYITNNNSPAPIYIPNNVQSYSLKIKNNAGTTIFNNLNVQALGINLGYVTAPTGKIYCNSSTPQNEQDYIHQNSSGTAYDFYANGALADSNFKDINGVNGAFSTNITVGGTSIRNADIITSGTFNQARLPDLVTKTIDFTDINVTNADITNLNINGNAVSGTEKGTFTPTFNGAPSATTLSGRYIKIGDKVDAYITIQGTAAQRASLSSGTLLEVANLPFLNNFTDQTGQMVKIIEKNGVYFYENNAETSAGFLDATAKKLYMFAYSESGRSYKTFGGVTAWASGDFCFYIHASYILN